jgi:hypothetical protein
VIITDDHAADQWSIADLLPLRGDERRRQHGGNNNCSEKALRRTKTFIL